MSSKTKFIILSQGRTGSTYLRYWLNHHPYIRCHDEVFLAFNHKYDNFQYFNNPEQTSEQILNFPGTTYHEDQAKTHLSKLNASPIENLVANYKSLEKAFRGTFYEKFLLK